MGRYDVELSFLGGVVGDLTRSGALVKVKKRIEDRVVMVDCGLWQGRKKEFLSRNLNLMVDPEIIDDVVLTHSHADHICGLPIFRNNGLGWNGKDSHVYCTHNTMDLGELMMLDTAKISEREAALAMLKARRISLRNKSKKGIRKVFDSLNKNEVGWGAKLYSYEDVARTMILFKGCDYKKWIKMNSDVRVKFYPSGHVLGGAICVLEVRTDNNGGNPIYIGFGGDLGRRDGIILPPPELPEENLDYFAPDGTYGKLIHPDRMSEIERLLELVWICFRTKGILLIPSFALERTQEIIYILTYAMFKKRIPNMRIFLDSPLAGKFTQIFSHNWKGKMFKDQYKLNFNPFQPGKYLTMIETEEESEALIRMSGPKIVIAGSGMGDAGRIRAHYRNCISSQKTIVAIVGYMAQGTLNRNLADGVSEIKIYGKVCQVRAKIEKFGGFSAHADKDFLIETSKEIVRRSPSLKKIFVIHAGEENGNAFAESLRSLGSEWKDRVVVPKLFETFKLA